MAATDHLPGARAMAETLERELAPTRLEVLDESAAHAGHAGANDQLQGTHFRVRIASPAFAGKSRVACHRLVYDALRPFIDQGVHAIAIEASVPSAPLSGDTPSLSQAIRHPVPPKETS